MAARVIGTGATELGRTAQAVVRLNGTIDCFLDAVLNYATLTEAFEAAPPTSVTRWTDWVRICHTPLFDFRPGTAGPFT